MKKIVIPVAVVAAILLVLFFSLGKSNNACNSSNADNADDANIAKKQATDNDSLSPADKKDTITIVAVGDMMLGTNYPTSPNYLPPNNDCEPLLKPLFQYLQDADVTFGNSEGVFSDKPEYARSCNNPKYCYRFSMPEKFAGCFKKAGFDVVSIANNHINDLGSYGRKNTQEVLKENGIHFAGLRTVPHDTFTIEGVKFGFCAFAPNSGTCQITNYDRLKKTVKLLEKETDFVIVSFHGGAEGSKHQHVPRKTEYFLGNNRGNVYKFAHTAVDAGADIVIGHGPHVTRSVELYKNRLIAYSLGNFCTYRRFSIHGAKGIAPILKVWTDSEGNFIKGKLIPTYQDEYKGTRYDEQNRVITKMQNLMAADFPETPIQITDKGDIIKK